MRFRLGVVTGFCAGYYLGAKAGRQRYEEIQRTLDKMRASDVYETATTKVKAIVDEGVDKAKSVVDEGAEKARSLVDEGVEKAKSLADRSSNTDADESSTTGTATVPAAAADPSAAPDGAGATYTAQPASNPAEKPGGTSA